MPISGSEVRISVRVQPNAAVNEVDFTDRLLKVKISAPPVKGRANKELIAFLSQILDVSKSKVCIVKGRTTRNKVIAINGISQQEIMGRLSTYSTH